MTQRKEIFIKVKEALTTIPQLELVDLQRRQFSQPKENYPTYFTAALIEVSNISWQSMVEQKQVGTATVNVLFYCKDGWMEQYNDTADDEHGLIEIDIIDTIVEKLQALKGDYFDPLDLTEENAVDEAGEMMSYQISFSTTIYRRINGKYNNVTLVPATIIV